MHVTVYTVDKLAAEQVAAMGIYDWATLMFAAFVVALTVVAELKDIELVSLSVQHAGDRLDPTWRTVLTIINGVRRWTFLPGLILAVPAVVAIKGGDALAVCFNTVALLFLAEVDNVAYTILLDDRIRAQVQQYARLELTEQEVAALAVSKAFYICVLVVAVPIAVWIAKAISFVAVLVVAFSSMWLGGIFETLVRQPASSIPATLKGIVVVTVKAIIGIAFWMMVGFGSGA